MPDLSVTFVSNPALYSEMTSVESVRDSAADGPTSVQVTVTRAGGEEANCLLSLNNATTDTTVTWNVSGAPPGGGSVTEIWPPDGEGCALLQVRAVGYNPYYTYPYEYGTVTISCSASNSTSTFSQSFEWVIASTYS